MELLKDYVEWAILALLLLMSLVSLSFAIERFF